MAILRRGVSWARPVRMRLTLLATGLVACALAIAAVVMVEALHHVLLRSADAATFARAEQIASTISTEGLGGIDESLLAGGQNVAVIQITDESGALRLANKPIYTRPMSPPVAAGQRLTIHGAHATDTEQEFQATAYGVKTAEGTLTIQVGAEEAPINATVVALGVLCSIVFPFIVVGMAFLTYVFVGRALRPVADIRARVDDISGGNLAQRVPVPATGDEVSALAVTMNEMLARIELSRTQQLQFVNDASHELNSPLTTLVGLLDLSSAKRQPIDPDTVDSVMLPDALRLKQMVADLLLLARADESGVPLHLDDVDLDEIVSSEVTRLEALTEHTVDAHIVAARVRGDADKLARALRNIADNAARHAAGRLCVTMQRDPDDTTITITVADDGEGIPDADKHRVTERFVRLDASRQRGSGGSGLGLAIVSEIVRAHGGTVIVGDADGGGASVGFRLAVEQAHD
ncbi:HAMP domain-containing protein [Gordonia sputi]|nr:HAMP domain-containing protein [Gordonia sputi]